MNRLLFFLSVPLLFVGGVIGFVFQSLIAGCAIGIALAEASAEDEDMVLPPHL